MNPPTLLARAFAVCILSSACGGITGAAESAPVDPTRPPSYAGDAAGGGTPGQVRVVQSVLIAPGRTNAVIDGVTVRVGSRVGDAKVVKIDESGVILSTGGKLESLRLFPFAQKTGPGQSRRQLSEERTP